MRVRKTGDLERRQRWRKKQKELREGQIRVNDFETLEGREEGCYRGLQECHAQVGLQCDPWFIRVGLVGQREVNYGPVILGNILPVFFIDSSSDILERRL